LPKLLSVNGGVFDGCEDLTSVEIPIARDVGIEAFKSCTSLISIELPSVRYVMENAFYGCSSLKSVYLPNVESLSNNVIEGCTNLGSLSLSTFDNIQLNYDGLYYMDVSMYGHTFDNFYSESCTLTLNANKKYGGSATPNVEADGVTWGGVKWKAIKYVD
jgi:hypothetical protein